MDFGAPRLREGTGRGRRLRKGTGAGLILGGGTVDDPVAQILAGNARPIGADETAGVLLVGGATVRVRLGLRHGLRLRDILGRLVFSRFVFDGLLRRSFGVFGRVGIEDLLREHLSVVSR
jgi:hypothetical protein